MTISQLPDHWDKQAREYTAQAAVMEGAKAIDSTIDQQSQVCTAATYRQCADQLRKALAKPAVPEWASALIGDMLQREIELTPAQSLEALSRNASPRKRSICGGLKAAGLPSCVSRKGPRHESRHQRHAAQARALHPLYTSYSSKTVFTPKL